MATDRTLAERAMACDGWEWRPGMADTDGNRCTAVCDGVPWFANENHPSGRNWSDADAVPDFDDGLTVLALLLLVREAWADSTLSAAVCLFGRWSVQDAGGKVCGYGASEAEALVHTLERAL